MKNQASKACQEQWRLTFTNTILALANYQADMLQVAAWANEAQKRHWQRDPVEVAKEEFASGSPPIPD